MSHRRPTNDEEKIDEIVTAHADYDAAWEPPIYVSPNERFSEKRNMAFQQHAYETLEEWAGVPYLSLTLLFTDIVDSTNIGIKLGDDRWIENLFVHFSKARAIASQFDCYVVKSIGDSFMVAFRRSTEAVLFGLEFSMNTGVDYIGIRVGINSGDVQIRENDIYGLNVNYTARVQHSLEKEGVLVSNSVKKDYEKRFGSNSGVTFVPKITELKSFGSENLWLAVTPDWRRVMRGQRICRARLLGKI